MILNFRLYKLIKMNEGVGVHEVQERQYGGYGHGKDGLRILNEIQNKFSKF